MGEADELDEISFKEKALGLALENNFVTELTSLVVVRPDEEPTINNLITENKDFGDYDPFKIYPFASLSSVVYSGPDYDYNDADDADDADADDEELSDITDTIHASQYEERSPCSGNLTLFSK